MRWEPDALALGVVAIGRIYEGRTMTEFNHGAFMETFRSRQGVVPKALYDDLMIALDVGLGRAPRPPVSIDPDWLNEARRHIGLKEIPGPTHNATILGWVKRLAGWFTDDETPWCGTFVAHCLDHVGIKDRPKHWYRAKDWASWGKSCGMVVGAIAVFGRDGGGHVGFVVGQSATMIYVLGGNQSNMVNIMPIARARLIATRWPLDRGIMLANAPQMTGGTVSRNEA